MQRRLGSGAFVLAALVYVGLRLLFTTASPSDPVAEYRARGTEPLLPVPLAAAVYPPSVVTLLAWLGAVIAIAAWMAWQGAARTVWLVPGIALLLQVPHAALVWHGSPVEIPRHALQVGVMTRLSLLLLSIFLIEAALAATQGRRRARTEAGTSESGQSAAFLRS